MIPGVLNSTLKEPFSLLGEIPNTNRVDNFGYDANDVYDAWDLMVEAAEQDSTLGLQSTFRCLQLQLELYRLIFIAFRYLRPQKQVAQTLRKDF